jgi:hypothetical protein
MEQKREQDGMMKVVNKVVERGQEATAKFVSGNSNAMFGLLSTGRPDV